jgi:pyruvate-ferredoxin/flavodoxin oxidoreductase
LSIYLEDRFMDRMKLCVDGNEAAAYVAHKTNEVIAIYPITPSSPMGEFSDQWSSDGQPNPGCS